MPVCRGLLLFFAAGGATVVVSVPKRAAASDARVVVEWSAPPSCPGGDFVRERIASLVRPTDSVHAHATITETDGLYRLAIHVESRGTIGDRTLADRSCAVLAQSAAVVLAMSGSGDGTEDSRPAETVAAPVREDSPHEDSAEAAEAIPASEAAAPKPSPTPSGRIRVAPLASVDVGTLPAPAFGGGLGLGFAPVPALTLEASGVLWTERQGTLPGDASQGAKLSFVTLGAAGCVPLTHHAVELLPCGLVEWARASAQGFGAAQTSNRVATWVSLGAEVRLRWELSRSLALVVGLEALVPTTRSEFVIASGGSVHETSIVTGRAHLGPEVRF